MRKIWICLKTVFDQTSKRGQILTKICFSPQNEPHTAKLCFAVVLKRFGVNSLKTSLFSQKMTLSERSSEILGKFLFLNKLEKGQIQRKIWISCKQPFLYKAVKLEQI